MVTFTTRGDDVQFSWDGHSVSLRGHAELLGQSQQDPSRQIRITAELIEGNLQTGRFEAVGDVLLVTVDASLRGDSLFFDANTP